MARKALLAAVLILTPLSARSQIPVPQSATPDGARLFRAQCGTCHSLNLTDPPRQGPNLVHVVGRKIGGVEGFQYTPGYKEAGAVWDEDRLDKYLTNPQAMFPGSTMVYRQANAATRKAIIDYLKEQS